MFAFRTVRDLVLPIALCSSTALTNAADYRFVNISKIVPGHSLALGSMNRSGTVAFTTYGPADNTQSIYSARGGPLTKLATATGEAAVWSAWEPDINRNGVVAFRSHVDKPGWYEPYIAGIFTASSQGVTTVAQYDNGTFSTPAAINDKGQVVSVVDWKNTGASSVVTFSPKRTIATFSNPENFFGRPDINNSGVVVFPESVGSEERIVTSTGGKKTIKVSSKDTDFTSLSLTTPRINDRGVIAFQATSKSFEQGVYIVDGQGLHTVADTTGPFRTLYSPSINIFGQVAFAAQLDNALDGVFTGPDPVADRVIVEGDALDGSIVAWAGGASINDAGQIAVIVNLADGREAIYRADPLRSATLAGVSSIAVPEPSRLWLVVTVWGALARFRAGTAGCPCRSGGSG